ncbi:MAG: hypothetical protein KC912_19390 [Proteobacteria bacterium]|nr:hypothetical protein [Pseudomonadota bacterium]
MPKIARAAATFGWLFCSGCPTPEDPAACFTSPDLDAASCIEAFSGELPEELAATGCFSLSEGLLEPAPELIPYDVAAPLFSDSADKQRFLMLPTGSAVTESNDQLALPDGAVLFKHFARAGVPIETRVIRREGLEHRYVTYVWDGAVAELNTTGARVVLPDGAWAVPSSADCSYCHGADQPLLGVSRAQLTRSICVDGEQVEQLDLWRTWGIGDFVSDHPLVDPQGEGTLDERARSYLHTNCAHCHRPAGWAVDIDMDLRFEQSLADTRTCDTPNQYFAGTSSPALRLSPGSPDDSSLVWRLSTDAEQRMAPFGLHTDPDGIALITEWIASIEACPQAR